MGFAARGEGPPNGWNTSLRRIILGTIIIACTALAFNLLIVSQNDITWLSSVSTTEKPVSTKVCCQVSPLPVSPILLPKCRKSKDLVALGKCSKSVTKSVTKSKALVAVGSTDTTHYPRCWFERTPACRFDRDGTAKPPATEDEWEAIVASIFGKEVLERGNACCPAGTLAAKCSQVCAANRDAQPDSLKPGDRAMSVAMLEKVLEFLRQLEELNGGMVPNTNQDKRFQSDPMPYTEVSQHLINAYLVLPLTRFSQVRKTPSWPRSWANFSVLWLYSHPNAWTNVHLLGQPNSFLAAAVVCLPRGRRQAHPLHKPQLVRWVRRVRAGRPRALRTLRKGKFEGDQRQHFLLGSSPRPTFVFTRFATPPPPLE
jgi:hypothetical protein